MAFVQNAQKINEINNQFNVVSDKIINENNIFDILCSLIEIIEKYKEIDRKQYIIDFIFKEETINKFSQDLQNNNNQLFKNLISSYIDNVIKAVKLLEINDNNTQMPQLNIEYTSSNNRDRHRIGFTSCCFNV